MTSGLGLFDEYNRQARLYPSLLAVLPPLMALLAWFPNLITSNIGTTLLTLAGSCGLLFALSVFSRSCGKRTEARLLEAWGGWPTTLWLRHSDTHLPRNTKERYHQALAQSVRGLTVPTAEMERENPMTADKAYDSAVGWLKEHCRGKDFPLILKENIEYGFRRNMRGVRPFAIAAVILALLASVFAIGYQAGAFSFSAIVAHVPMAAIGTTGLLVIALIGWVVFVRDAWVREAGDQYARALLAECEKL